MNQVLTWRDDNDKAFKKCRFFISLKIKHNLSPVNENKIAKTTLLIIKRLYFFLLKGIPLIYFLFRNFC